ncbi:MAG: hypothetical protein LKM32_02055 [Chiayiivirga sp.]|jgi:hypothetical protein|uniref:hypothetical protein n=1 Tax=Chiayiivirga sp. TaxID=2041042 RepID=UPI0025BB3C29|nr:hypothetical protein [Chiayiivirga sp.]MCI1710968.1 hypothetical protein [Chiayiivirga sp.]MCI1728219.1 hypothetical protein [Chiayiivirga sp.]
MHIDHLRKQAKNLKSLYPDLVAAHGATLSLAQAQDAVARTHGFPSWKAALGKNAPAPAAAPRVIAGPRSPANDAALAGCIRAGYHFVASEESQLAVEIADGGVPARFAPGHELELRFTQPGDAAVVRREDRALDEIADQFDSPDGTFEHYLPHEREILLYHAREAVQRCPLYLDGWNRVAGVMFEDEEFGPALATIEPVAQALLDLLPAGIVQVCYGMLEHRPFFRLMHTYLLLLDAVGRHAEADRLALRLYALWPMDNIGFRFLLTRQARAEA